MQQPRIYADFQNADSKGRIRLNCAGTLEDLARQEVTLKEGLEVGLYSEDVDEAGCLDELRSAGIVQFSAEEGIWVASINWADIHHASDDGGGPSRQVPKRQVG